MFVRIFFILILVFELLRCMLFLLGKNGMVVGEGIKIDVLGCWKISRKGIL